VFRHASVRLLIFLFVTLVLDISVMPMLSIAHTQPVLIYLPVVYAALQWGAELTLTTAIWTGVLRELASAAPAGVEISSVLLGAYLLVLMIRKMEHSPIFFRMAIAFLFVGAVRLIHLSYCLFLGSQGLPAGQLFAETAGCAFYSAVLCPVFFVVTALWFRDRQMLRQLELFNR